MAEILELLLGKLNQHSAPDGTIARPLKIVSGGVGYCRLFSHSPSKRFIQTCGKLILLVDIYLNNLYNRYILYPFLPLTNKHIWPN